MYLNYVLYFIALTIFAAIMSLIWPATYVKWNGTIQDSVVSALPRRCGSRSRMIVSSEGKNYRVDMLSSECVNGLKIGDHVTIRTHPSYNTALRTYENPVPAFYSAIGIAILIGGLQWKYIRKQRRNTYPFA